MKKLQAEVNVRVVAATLVSVAVIGLSTLAMHAPAQTPNPITLKSIQTDKTTVFYAEIRPSNIWFVEMVLADSDSKAAAENLKTVAATL